MEGKANKLLKINNDDRGNSAQRIKSPYQTSVAYENMGTPSKETTEKNVQKEQGFSEKVPQQKIRIYLKGNSLRANVVDRGKTQMNEKIQGGGTLMAVLTSAGHKLKEVFNHITSNTSD